MKDRLIIDPIIEKYVEFLNKKYPEIQLLVLEKRKNKEKLEYLYLVGLIIKKEHRGKGIAARVIQDVLKYADKKSFEVHAWASDVFGTDLNRWVPFLEKLGFEKIDDENNLIYFSKTFRPISHKKIVEYIN